MNIHLQRKLAALALLESATFVCSAQPISLDTAEMDLVTAGIIGSAYERISIRVIGSYGAAGTNSAPNWLTLTLGQMTSLGSFLATQPPSLQETGVSNRADIYQIEPGTQLIIYRQSSQGSALSLQPASGELKTYQLRPGETLQVWSSNGANYAYIHSTGNTIARVLSN